MITGTFFEEYITSINGEINERYFKRLLHVIEIVKTRYPYKMKRIKHYETHHIIPKSWGGSNDSDNLVQVPYKVHFLIHKLMTKSFPTDIKMLTAYWFMTNYNTEFKTRYGKEYERLRLEYRRKIKEHPSMFKGNVPVFLADGSFNLIPRKIYDSNSYEYSHVAKGTRRSDTTINRWVEDFRTGRRVSYRKGKVMAIDTKTNKNVLIDRDIFYNDDNYIGIFKNKTLTPEQRKKVSEYMKTVIKSDGQRESARQLMKKLCENTILCGCCGKYFNIGNYSNHINGSPLKGKPKSTEVKNACREGIMKYNEKHGVSRPITLIHVDGKEYISYNMDDACKIYGVSRPTFRKRVRPIKVGRHRNRNVTYATIDISLYEVYEDIIENSHPHMQE